MERRRLVKVKVEEVEGEKVVERFHEDPTVAGTRYSVEVEFAPGDRLILDGPSVEQLEKLVRLCLPASRACRRQGRGDQHPESRGGPLPPPD